jgi:hypothetical protein
MLFVDNMQDMMKHVTQYYCRNVILNLRIGTPETSRLGLDKHICELQLTLRDFAELLVRDVLPPSPAAGCRLPRMLLRILAFFANLQR